MKIQTDTGLAFDLSGPGFAAISLFRSTDKVRRYLHGVRVEPLAEGGALLIATDGVMLAVYRDETATAPRPVTLAIDKPAAGREKFYFCGENQNDYVNWRGVIPPVSTPIKISNPIYLNAKHIKVFWDAAKKLGSFPCLKIMSFKNDEQSYHLIDFGNPKFFGLLMPFNASSDYAPYLRPSFLDAEPRRAETEGTK